MSQIKLTSPFTEDEQDFLLASGFSAIADSLDYYAKLGDLRVLPLIDNVVNAQAMLYSTRENMVYTLQYLIDYYEQNGGDESILKDLRSRQAELKVKYNLT
jgi:hypothetical protein